ncbi:MAG TPA: hypothetical protein VM533_17520 [Fimbriiglobus sp.]|nr:hypothetical protein [Fimbriiglobus sp.]
MGSRDKIRDGRTIQSTADKGLIYTCRCGWIDIGHANPASKYPNQGAVNLWANVNDETGERSRNGAWHKVTHKIMMGMRKKIPGFGWEVDGTFGPTRHYAVRVGLSTAEKEEVALAIFMDVSIAAEELQGTFWPVSDSSFSGEDLLSNLIGFYDAVRRPDFNKLFLYQSCLPVSKAAALMVWDTHGSIGTHKVREFNRPLLFPCRDCPGGGPRFPMPGLPLPELNAIKKAVYGWNYRVWKPDDPVLRDPLPPIGVLPPIGGIGAPLPRLATVAIGGKCRKLPGQTYDSLSRIAQDFYDDPLLWPVLYHDRTNRQEIGDNPNVVKIGQPIIVPDIKRLTEDDRKRICARGRDWRLYNS